MTNNLHKILLLGSGGREHAFALQLAKSKHCTQLYIAPGNAGTAACGENVSLDPLDFVVVASFVQQHQITMVMVGPEEPLVRGIWDYFQADDQLRNVLVVGPSAAGAVLEGSKAWAKQFMLRHQVPTAAYREFGKDELAAATEYVASQPLPIVLKADGLAAGKGVVICQSHQEATKELKAMLGGKFGDASAKVVIEAFLSGIEFSVFVLTDGKNYKILPEAKDYKRAKEGDKGPNTGGMGAVSPVPFVNEVMWRKVEQHIIIPTVNGLRKEKIPYRGFIFFGLISVGGEPFVIEYNCRMGDPETEVVLPRLKNDLVLLLQACAHGRLGRAAIKQDKRTATTVMLVSKGYPGDYEKGKAITGIEDTKGCIVLHAGTKATPEGSVVSNGGRVIAVTALAKDIPTALSKSYRNARKIKYEGRTFRRDIGLDLM